MSIFCVAFYFIKQDLLDIIDNLLNSNYSGTWTFLSGENVRN